MCRRRRNQAAATLATVRRLRPCTAQRELGKSTSCRLLGPRVPRIAGRALLIIHCYATTLSPCGTGKFARLVEANEVSGSESHTLVSKPNTGRRLGPPGAQRI